MGILIWNLGPSPFILLAMKEKKFLLIGVIAFILGIAACFGGISLYHYLNEPKKDIRLAMRSKPNTLFDQVFNEENDEYKYDQEEGDEEGEEDKDDSNKAKPNMKSPLKGMKPGQRQMYKNFFGRFFGDDFFNTDPRQMDEDMKKMDKEMREQFRQAERMRNQMFQNLLRPPGAMGDTGGGGMLNEPSPFGMGFGTTSQSFSISQREDKKYTYIDIEAEGLDKDKLNVKVENGMIHLSGMMERKTNNMQFSSQVHRSFSVPPDVDPDGLEISNEGKKIVLK